MEHLTSCDLCKNINTNGICSSRSNKQNYNEISVFGNSMLNNCFYFFKIDLNLILKHMYDYNEYSKYL